jgi:hypothetical protein
MWQAFVNYDRSKIYIVCHTDEKKIRSSGDMILTQGNLHGYRGTLFREGNRGALISGGHDRCLAKWASEVDEHSRIVMNRPAFLF